MKSILISIRPKWCQKIVSGEKTIEVRKTRPTLETPFKCYIYCTNIKPDLNIPISQERIMQDYLDTGSMKSLNCPRGNGKVIGEFTCDWVSTITYDGGMLSSTTNAAFSPATCLSRTEIIAYIGDKGRCYGWRITDLVIYDEPRELSEFERWYECDRCTAKWATDCNHCHEKNRIKHPPQDWCYVEELWA